MAQWLGVTGLHYDYIKYIDFNHLKYTHYSNIKYIHYNNINSISNITNVLQRFCSLLLH